MTVFRHGSGISVYYYYFLSPYVLEIHAEIFIDEIT